MNEDEDRLFRTLIEVAVLIAAAAVVGWLVWRTFL
jgi:hypothetical protein